MFNVWLAGDHLYGQWLFNWLSLVMSLMVSYFVLSFFPRDLETELSQFLRVFLPSFTLHLISAMICKCIGRKDTVWSAK